MKKVGNRKFHFRQPTNHQPSSAKRIPGAISMSFFQNKSSSHQIIQEQNCQNLLDTKRTLKETKCYKKVFGLRKQESGIIRPMQGCRKKKPIVAHRNWSTSSQMSEVFGFCFVDQSSAEHRMLNWRVEKTTLDKIQGMLNGRSQF